jgi:hydrogenase maturation protease
MQRYLIGLGNYAMGDDSIGLRVIEYVESKGMARGFEAIEAGNDGVRVLACFTEEVERVVIADCARMGLEPGEYRWLDPDDLESRKVTGGFSTHEGDIVKLLAMAREIGLPVPIVRILGIEPASTNAEMSLSPALQRRLPEYAGLAVREILAGERAAG